MALDLNDRIVGTTGHLPMTGIQALARLPFEAVRDERRKGRRVAAFVSGYEGSPLAGYDLELQRHRELLAENEIIFEPGVNEELAATAVQGSQLAAASPECTTDSVLGFWYGKSPGLDRAADSFRHSILMGVPANGGAVAFVGDDPAAKSSTVPCASERLMFDLGMPTLYPQDAQDVIDLGRHAVAMSRASGLWVGLKIAVAVADGSSSVDLSSDRVVIEGPERAVDHTVTAKMLQPTLDVLERSRDGERTRAAIDYAQRNGLNEVIGAGRGDRVGIVAAGPTFLELRRALELLGLHDDALRDAGVRLLRLGMISPLEPKVIMEFARDIDEIIVVEEKRSFIEAAIRDLLYGVVGAPAVIGKRHPDGRTLFPSNGELSADTISTALAARLADIGGFPTVDHWRARRRPARIPLAISPRKPFFCSGCPHNLSTKVPEGTLVGAGIGCHGMVVTMSDDQLGHITGLTQMGGEGAQWIGMAPFVSHGHLVQNLGDGTFHHSGSLAIRAAVAAGSHITYKLLYNSAVAMTGGQSAVGGRTVAEICRGLLSEGVTRIIITTEDPRRHRRGGIPRGVQVWHRDRLIEAQTVLAASPGVTVVIHDQECATELRRKRKRGLAPDPRERVLINERVCEGCGDCGEVSSCLSVQPVDTEFGRKTRIDQSSCNKDYSCLHGDCPSFVRVLPGTQPVVRPEVQPIGPNAFPDPSLERSQEHVTRITGVGGTGVVTVSQILTVAATLAGNPVRTLDQTGLAQKGGAVVSDIIVTPAEAPATGPRANRATDGECDLYLAADLLVGADPRYLRVAEPERTAAVVSTSKVATGEMVVDPDVVYPDTEPIVREIASVSRPGLIELDARRLATELLGHDQFSNLLLIGVAFQSGALPIPAAAIEEAIRVNGVQIDANVQAFRRGRQFVADAAEFERARRASVPAPVKTIAPDVADLIGLVDAGEGSELQRLLAIRVPDLVQYQDRALARSYAQAVEMVRRAEATMAPSDDGLAEAVARNLYKLMSYKDEYEVARLALDPQFIADAYAQFGADATLSYQLHPPFLRALGMKSKISLGPWFRPAFRVLASMRRLRGTAWDIFGYASVRRLERELVAEYRSAIDAIVAGLESRNHAHAVEIAELPELVRGYEEIKVRNVAKYRARLEEQLAAYAEPVAVESV
ncbi:indolepyruvate ferredoxin oxidoreductase family protein [Agromyces sp. SYSU T00266]|uniref:indolepyruvate ferredoxin oxidoreductase family protein n=1 Tax=Agromyces zhanjiangensis TaxID=3158562 RepID=UPI0033956FF0